MIIAGCAQQQQGKYVTTPATPAPATAPAQPAAPAMNGKVTGYFPSGKVEGSGIALEKDAPAEVLAGQPYEYTIKAINLTDATLENVKVTDKVSGNFASTDSDPKASSMDGGVATWNLGTLAPKETKTITIKGSSADEGTVTTCGTVTYNPVICEDIKVVKANIQLTKTEPADVTICDPIPVDLAVKNSGSSALTGVQITDTLPAGMTSDGKSTLTFDIGNLAPGETKAVKYTANATVTGKLDNTAKATSTQGVTADAAASTTVHQAVLAVTCKSPEQQYRGRNFDTCYTIVNNGDAAAPNSKFDVIIPAGLTATSATAGGVISAGGISWDLGSLDPKASKDVCATFTTTNAGSYTLAGTVKGGCASNATTSCTTRVVGISAILLEKSDDPDPVAIGDTTTYTVKVTNQGSADDSNVQVVVTIADELVPISTTEGTIAGQTVTLPVVPKLGAKEAVTYKIVAKGVKAGDGHTRFTLSSDVLRSPINAEESTTVY
jgi:uncharacterized repeat protein (TIGR01451 family)